MTELLQRILPTVQKPARYIGGEYNETIKDPAQVRVQVAFCFPDTYEIGMSNLGMRILYGVMNEMDGVWCQRVFAPWGDMEAAMRQNNLPLWALESKQPVKDFDMIILTCGMGGGTGTGATPFLAKLCKDAGILTVAVVTTPFTFESMPRTTASQAGIEELKQCVDTLLVIPNDKLLTLTDKPFFLQARLSALRLYPR